jgi:hypothetical protein
MTGSTSTASSVAETRSLPSTAATSSKNGFAGSTLPVLAPSGAPVSSVRVGSEDARGVNVEQIYAIKDARYAIYRAHDRMMVHFADDPRIADEQRKQLNGLAGMRAKLAMLTAALDKSAAYYDGQVAHALQLALDGEGEKASEIMAQAVELAEQERASRGRIQYLLCGLATAAAFLVVLGIGYAAVTFAKPANNLWLAAIGGAIGAVFSMSIAIRSRAVALDLYRNANIADGALRILVGVISAGVLVLLMATDIIPKLQVGGGALTGETATWETILLVGFIAGFLERLLPDILSARKDAPAQAEQVLVAKPAK